LHLAHYFIHRSINRKATFGPACPVCRQAGGRQGLKLLRLGSQKATHLEKPFLKTFFFLDFNLSFGFFKTNFSFLTKGVVPGAWNVRRS